MQEPTEPFSPQTVRIEDNASGTQSIHELANKAMHAINQYEPTTDKNIRMHSITNMNEYGLFHMLDKATWLDEPFHELASLSKDNYGDQADDTSQALDWFKKQ